MHPPPPPMENKMYLGRYLQAREAIDTIALLFSSKNK